MWKQGSKKHNRTTKRTYGELFQLRSILVLIASICFANILTAAENQIKLPVAAVIRTNLALFRAETGELRPNREVLIHTKVAGFVGQVLVELGAQVAEGQLLATIEVPELDADLRRGRAVERKSREEVKKSEAQLEEADLTLKRLEAVADLGKELISAQEIDTARVRARIAQSTLAAAKEQVEVARSEITRLETLHSFTRVTAPFAGTATRVSAVPGQWVSIGGTGGVPNGLFRISETAKLRLVFPISSSDVTATKIGSPLNFRINGNKRSFAATISRLAGQIESATRTMDVEVDVDNSQGLIVPGCYAELDLVKEIRTNTLVIPLQAVCRSGNEVYAWRVSVDGHLEKRPITSGLELPNQIEVTEGLASGDKVVVGRVANLAVGQLVQPIEFDPTPKERVQTPK
jgi:RND family efflux transporter MFP subunit